ncbi:MAG TPA: class I SAM-dependent methyltransferase [Trueperaceae bacterium]|nr:class I SAM-dependent methyltransferase [Trueperaceae bacterium]
MSESSRHDAWQAGESYDLYMGRWSRRVAPHFLDWLSPQADARWLDVGCGTGALSEAIVRRCRPRSVVAVDRSPGFLARARENVPDARVSFEVGDAQSLPVPTASVDIAVSGLMLNFVPDRLAALASLRRAARAGGLVAFYVWDYPGGSVEFMRKFWSAATGLDPAARSLNEDVRFPFCTQPALLELARQSGLGAVESVALEADTVFADFDDYWRPFTLGAGPAPGYCANLEPAARERLREALFNSLPRSEDGSIPLRVRAWGVRGVSA